MHVELLSSSKPESDRVYITAGFFHKQTVSTKIKQLYILRMCDQRSTKSHAPLRLAAGKKNPPFDKASVSQPTVNQKEDYIEEKTKLHEK